MSTRDVWNSRTGFLLAAVGSAVGLGNIWRFPYIAYKNGGGAFLIPYFISIFLVGLPLMVLEQGLGQRYQGPATHSFAKLRKPFELLGWVGAVTLSMGVQIYYAVVLSWCLNYFHFSTNLSWGSDTESFFYKSFLNLSNTPSLIMGNLQWPIVVGLIFVWGFCWWILTRGISRGIEMANRICMPILLVLMVVLVIWSLSLEGASEGISAYITPDFSKLTDISIWQAAVGQIFFSLSLAFGMMIVYSSYLPTDHPHLASNARITVFSNSAFEIFAGFAVFATLGFMANIKGVPVADVVKEGAGLAFVTYPAMINELPFAPELFGAIFFLTLIFAGLSSTISITEILVSALIHKFGWARAKVVTVVTFIGLFLGLIFTSQSGLYYLDIMDYFITNFGLIVVGLLEAILIGWLVGADKFLNEIKITLPTPAKWTWKFAIKFFIPLMLGIILIGECIKNAKTPYGGYSWELICWVGLGWMVVSFLISLVFYAMKFKGPGNEPEINPLEVHTH